MSFFRIYDGEANNKATKLMFGKSSGIRDYDNLRFPPVRDMTKSMFGEYWIEDEIRLGKDVEDYREKLNDRERYVFNTVTGKLNWLDSMATDFVNVLYMLITDSGFRSALGMIASFEQLHNRSYQYLTSTVLNSVEKVQSFDDTRNIETLNERNKLIIEPMQRTIDIVGLKLVEDTLIKNGQGHLVPSEEEVVQAVFEGLVAYLNLEGLFFSGGFVYFHSLARDQKMIGSNNLITMIKTDENQHGEVFGYLLQVLMKEFPYLNTSENLNYAETVMKKAVELEKEWSSELFEGINTMSIFEYHDYVEYLSNLICRNSGIPEQYPENKTIKSKWISTYGSKKRTGSDDEIPTRTDFLQTDGIDYEHEGGEGFDL